MKKLYHIAFFLIVLSSVTLSAQVAINTTIPYGGVNTTLHIDAMGNNTTAHSASQTTDDILITSTGNVAIGHINPSNKLHIKTQGTSTSPIAGLRIRDGGEGNTKLLISDSSGKAKWAYAGEIPMVRGVLSSTGTTIALHSISTLGSFSYANAYIDLPPGRWLVTASMILASSGTGTGTLSSQTNYGWVRSSFSDRNQAPLSASADLHAGIIYISGIIYANGYGYLTGSLTLVNRGTTTKRYYYCLAYSTLITLPTTVNISNFANSGSAENYILAFRMSDN